MGLAEVASHVRAARRARRQTQAEFGRDIGLSTRVVTALESGRPHRYDPTTVDRIERVLGWQPGSFERVAGGGQPVVDVDPQLARILDAWPRLSPDTRRVLADLAGRALDD